MPYHPCWHMDVYILYNNIKRCDFMSEKPRGNFTMSENFSQLREYAYRTCIPYFIFWDSELTLNHHRLYCLIEQMESNPNPKVKPTFSYKWFADLLGIDVRSAKRIAQTLKRKNYIEHVRLSDNTWIWRTVKNIGNNK